MAHKNAGMKDSAARDFEMGTRGQDDRAADVNRRVLSNLGVGLFGRVQVLNREGRSEQIVKWGKCARFHSGTNKLLVSFARVPVLNLDHTIVRILNAMNSDAVASCGDCAILNTREKVDKVVTATGFRLKIYDNGNRHDEEYCTPEKSSV